MVTWLHALWQNIMVAGGWGGGVSSQRGGQKMDAGGISFSSASEGLVHGCLVPCIGAGHHGGGCVVETGPHFLADEKHRKMIQDWVRVGRSLKDALPVTYFLQLDLPSLFNFIAIIPPYNKFIQG